MSPGLYVHVPFCLTKCPYCGFASEVRGDRGRWLSALEVEGSLRRGELDGFDSLYVGGGTPSVLAPEELERLFGALRASFTLLPGAEVTVELNPDDVTAELVATLRGLGATRLSLGVQSFDDASLRLLGRRHDGAAARRAIELVRLTGAFTLSVDLIHGLPGQPRAAALADVDVALELEPEHLSCYALTVEPGTPLARRVEAGAPTMPDEATGRELFLAVSERLVGRGYEHYEVSNYARGPAARARHNQKYWRREATLGLGPSAHSFRAPLRRWNVRDVATYCDRLLGGALPVEGEEVLTEEQALIETLMLGLRTSDGVPTAALEGLGGWERSAETLEAEGLVRRAEGRLAPTREGLVVADGLPLLFLRGP